MFLFVLINLYALPCFGLSSFISESYQISPSSRFSKHSFVFFSFGTEQISCFLLSGPFSLEFLPAGPLA